jgi:IS5 family transposase
MIVRDNWLIQLAKAIDWVAIDMDLERFYSEGVGRPALSSRLYVALEFLKAWDGLSDRDVIRFWLENPYYRIFTSGWEHVSSIKAPCHPTALVKFRQKVGEEGFRLIFKRILEMLARVMPELKDIDIATVDTFAQVKYTAFPTTTKLIVDAVWKMQEIGQRFGVSVPEKDMLEVARLREQLFFTKEKGARKDEMVESLRAVANRILNRMNRNISSEMRSGLGELDRKRLRKDVSVCRKAINQKKDDKNKVYSIYEESVCCVARGKPHCMWEFGVKCSIAIDLRTGVIVALICHPDNPYDGHTLAPLADEIRENIPGCDPKYFNGDLAFRVTGGNVKGIRVLTPNLLRDPDLPDDQREWLKDVMRKRSSVEPVISHLMSDFGVGRNLLHGHAGDAINLLRAGIAYNVGKYLRCHLHIDRAGNPIKPGANKRKLRRSLS